MTTAYLMTGGVNVAQPSHVPPARYGVFLLIEGQDDVHWCGMRFDDARWAAKVAERLTVPYEIRPLAE